MVELDYSAIGFLAGIEIHQQLNTRKLFCECEARIRSEPPQLVTRRKLHAVASEMGEYDPAALHEAHRNRTFHYQSYFDSVCLVELGEEPPHPVNRNALAVVLQTGLMLAARVVDEIQVMRKTVIDGSNTAGFQRTMLVATDGMLETSEGDVTLQYFCLEEDAARIIATTEREVEYRLDRLGIPLLEIVTGPVFVSPRQAGEVAERLGHIIRSLNVRRGIGSIRQDVNVSTSYGTRIEIKGVQRHRMIPTIMANEAGRQVELHRIAEMLEKVRSAPDRSELEEGTADVTEQLRNSSVEVIRHRLERGDIITAVRAPGLTGMLGHELCPGKRLGTEMKDQVLTLGIRGIIHSDEDLPGYGFTAAEVAAVKQAVGLEKQDGFLLFAAHKGVVPLALDKLYARIPASFEGVPKESRRSLPDGNSQYMRPLPGEARMYPETDIPPVAMTPEFVERVRAVLPEILQDRLERYARQYDLPLHDLWKIEEHIDSFVCGVEELGLEPRLVFNILASNAVHARRESGTLLETVALNEILAELAAGRLLREAVPEVLERIGGGETLDTVVDSLRDQKVDLAEEVRRIIDRHPELADHPKRHAILMGKAMEVLRGRVAGRLVSEALAEALTREM
jgi:glutamyl-tRNA(Gln) amidotransferase subunit E